MTHVRWRLLLLMDPQRLNSMNKCLLSLAPILAILMNTLKRSADFLRSQELNKILTLSGQILLDLSIHSFSYQLSSFCH